MDISRRDFELFLVVADERSFTRAATRCGLSQSALSARIKSLEEMLGVTLFDRTTRAVELTSEGRLFEVSARRLFSELTEVIDDFRDHSARRKGRVRVAALPSISPSWLPSVFSRFRADYPGIELVLTDALSEVCLDNVRSGDADMAITSVLNINEDLHAVHLATDYFHLVCPKGHPLMSLAEITPDDLIQYPFVHALRRSSVRQHIDAAFHPRVPQTAIEVQYMGSIAGMVEAGFGIALVPALTLWQFRRPSLVSRPVIMEGLSRPIYLLKRRGHVMSPAAQAFYEYAVRSRKSLEFLAKVGGPTGPDLNLASPPPAHG